MMKRPRIWRHEFASVSETLRMTYLLFVEQMKALKGNVAAGLVCLGLLLLPPLYAWFNIAANWSPYDNTSDLKVAVTSLDEGAEIDGVSLNIGDKIVEALKANDSIGWQFVTYDEGHDGVESGEYYAALVIPADFSETLAGFIYGGTEKATIDYYINEKENAISTKIMGTGMNTVSGQINDTFVETISTIVLDSLKVVDSKYTEYKPNFIRMIDTMDLAAQNMSLFVKNMDAFEDTLDAMDDLTENAESILPGASQALQDASDLTLDAQNALQSSKSTVSDIRRLLEQNVISLNSYSDDLVRKTESLSEIGAESIDEATESLQELIDTTDQLRSHVATLADNIASYNKLLAEESVDLTNFVSSLDTLESDLESASSRLKSLKKSLSSGKKDVADVADQAASIITDMNTNINDVWNAYNDGVSASLQESAESLSTTLDDSYKLLQSLSGLIPKVDSVLGSVRSMGSVSKETFEKCKTIISDTQELLEKSVSDLRDLTEDEQFEEVLEFLQQDVEKQSAFLAEPVEMETHRLYPVANYGSGMSPFYTTLSIWVGVLLMMAMISTVNEKGLEAYPKARVTPMYLSRLMLYQCVSALQCTVIALGDLFILGVVCRHPVLFVLLCIYIGQIFSVFVFSLVFTFSAIGKALAIIVLVLQIAASGGTFPIEMTPAFFQFVHPFLPFTYCIGAMREICFGIDAASLAIDMAAMFTLPVISVAGVILFGPLMRRFVIFFEKSMKKSGLM